MEQIILDVTRRINRWMTGRFLAGHLRAIVTSCEGCTPPNSPLLPGKKPICNGAMKQGSHTLRQRAEDGGSVE